MRAQRRTVGQAQRRIVVRAQRRTVGQAQRRIVGQAQRRPSRVMGGAPALDLAAVTGGHQ